MASGSGSLLHFHHVGFVVPDITAGLSAFRQSLPLSWDGHVFSDPLQKVNVAFLSAAPGEASIELVAPHSEESPVSRFLVNGGGLHHVCYEVENLEDAVREMRSRGASIAGRPKPAVAFAGRRIAWVITREKLLIELLETSVPPAAPRES